MGTKSHQIRKSFAVLALAGVAAATIAGANKVEARSFGMRAEEGFWPVVSDLYQHVRDTAQAHALNADSEKCGFVCHVKEYMPGTFKGCLGDVDGNGVVNPGDRAFISANIGQTDPVKICLYDLDGNGHINPADRGFISANLGRCAPLEARRMRRGARSPT